MDDYSMEKLLIGKTAPGSRRNPVAAASILRKGGAHEKSRTSERAAIRRQLRRETADWQRRCD